jgi:sulfur-carrier protein adenylyltransferase/sulfurtransferase
LIDYEIFCGVKKATGDSRQATVGEISVFELKKMMDEKADFQLIDVREAYEYEVSNLGGTLIPLSILSENMDKIARGKTVVVHCKSGARSAKAIDFLKEHGVKNVLNLTGGIVAFEKEFKLEV